MTYYHIILFCLFILFVFKALVYYRNNVILDKIKRKFKAYHKDLSDILRIILPIFDKLEIKYVLYGGTLLGYARHNKYYIPWDDDVDIAVFSDAKFKDKLNKLQDELKQYNMSLKPKPFGYNITQRGKDSYVDLFIFKDRKGNKYLPNDWTLERYPNEYFYHNELFPIIKDSFDNITVNIPKKYKKFLRRSYGKDCLTNYKLFNVHHVNFLDNMIIYITQKISIPA